MCLIYLAWKHHPHYKLILAGNRDEFYERPTREAGFWKDNPNLLSGKDLKGGGTWLGVTKDGKFSAITNYRDPRNIKKNAPTRGHLITNYLSVEESPKNYFMNIRDRLDHYNGFNLLLGSVDALYYFNNIKKKLTSLDKGIYGLSNAFLNSPWPKVTDGLNDFQSIISGTFNDDHLFDLLTDTRLSTDERLPNTGIPFELEKKLSARFIRTELYGTCCSTVLTIDQHDNVSFTERVYPVGKRKLLTSNYKFKISQTVSKVLSS